MVWAHFKITKSIHYPIRDRMINDDFKRNKIYCCWCCFFLLTNYRISVWVRFCQIVFRFLQMQNTLLWVRTAHRAHMCNWFAEYKKNPPLKRETNFLRFALELLWISQHVFFPKIYFIRMFSHESITWAIIFIHPKSIRNRLCLYNKHYWL